ncbi:hypothetical protein I307_02574 [Cryptococcus deuterogattii 99/473]|uniref:Uncharacterized protein n=1 Tax=Cryptococcus deuterogattii Ram5 TaxID=1296110 RepID=A0A0D0T268_9TREE|nr:hypothetical protein I313_04285 [Cryptococcus deuterogattii Ram5]KIY57900.1 hypothetical protein I307_02574 [Cryptococcus deuterogattii 99/473]
MSMIQKTPPRLPASFLVEESSETPGPSRARINNLQHQVSELVRKNQTLERKLTAVKSASESDLKAKATKLSEMQVSLRSTQRELERSKKELERCVLEGSGMKEELQLHSMVQQQKALLAVAQEQMLVVELEARLLDAEKARILRDHKITLFQVKEEELVREIEERDIRIEDLEVMLESSNACLEQERNTIRMASSSQLTSSKDLSKAQMELESARAEINTLEDKVASLETKVRGLKDREKEARSELESWLREEGSASKYQKEKKESQIQLRAMKSELEKKKEEIEELKEELEEAERSGKEKEKVLKKRLRDANEEKERLLGIEEELRCLRAGISKASTGNRRIRKESPVKEGSGDEVTTRKKAKKVETVVSPSEISSKERSKAKASTDSSSELDDFTPIRVRKSKTARKSPIKSKPKLTPLEGSNAENELDTLKVRASKGETVEQKSVDKEETTAPAVEKKKKKRILGTQPPPTFNWDPVMNSGDGVIPAYLSPLRPDGVRATGNIPRAGFPSLPSSRLNRFG